MMLQTCAAGRPYCSWAVDNNSVIVELATFSREKVCHTLVHETNANHCWIEFDWLRVRF